VYLTYFPEASIPLPHYYPFGLLLLLLLLLLLILSLFLSKTLQPALPTWRKTTSQHSLPAQKLAQTQVQQFHKPLVISCELNRQDYCFFFFLLTTTTKKKMAMP